VEEGRHLPIADNEKRISIFESFVACVLRQIYQSSFFGLRSEKKKRGSRLPAGSAPAAGTDGGVQSPANVIIIHHDDEYMSP
jgi:hypothetical protein